MLKGEYGSGNDSRRYYKAKGLVLEFGLWCRELKREWQGLDSYSYPYATP